MDECYFRLFGRKKRKNLRVFLNGFGLGVRYRCTFGGGRGDGFLKFYGVLVWAQFAIFRKCARSQYFSFCVQVPAFYVCSEPSRGAYIDGEGEELFCVFPDLFRILCLFRFLFEDVLLGMRSLTLHTRKSSSTRWFCFSLYYVVGSRRAESIVSLRYAVSWEIYRPDHCKSYYGALHTLLFVWLCVVDIASA